MMQTISAFFYRLLKRNRAQTIKHSFSLASIAIVALLATVLLSANDSYIRLETPENTVQAGDSFEVSVYVNAKQSVNAIDVAVAFPKDKVAVDGIDVGNSVISLWTQDPYVEDDEVILRGGTYRKGFIGEHLLARINFTALKTGKAELLINEKTLLAGDGTGTPVSNVKTSPVVITTISADGELTADVEIMFTTDIDGDGDVSLEDVQVFLRAWRQKRWMYDFNDDNRMNFTDFAIILADSFFH